MACGTCSLLTLHPSPCCSGLPLSLSRCSSSTQSLSLGFGRGGPRWPCGVLDGCSACAHLNRCSSACLKPTALQYLAPLGPCTVPLVVLPTCPSSASSHHALLSRCFSLGTHLPKTSCCKVTRFSNSDFILTRHCCMPISPRPCNISCQCREVRYLSIRWLTLLDASSKLD